MAVCVLSLVLRIQTNVNQVKCIHNFKYEDLKLYIIYSLIILAQSVSSGVVLYSLLLLLLDSDVLCHRGGSIYRSTLARRGILKRVFFVFFLY